MTKLYSKSLKGHRVLEVFLTLLYFYALLPVGSTVHMGIGGICLPLKLPPVLVYPKNITLYPRQRVGVYFSRSVFQEILQNKSTCQGSFQSHQCRLIGLNPRKENAYLY